MLGDLRDNIILRNDDNTLTCHYGKGKRSRLDMMDRINRNKYHLIDENRRKRWFLVKEQI
jgi:hypothetical protein